MRVARIWRYMISRIRLGQEHNIDRFLPHLPPGTLTVRCPACPDPDLNMRPNWWLTPRYFRHINQMRITLDGNHQMNQFYKNTDPWDKSLYGGNSYFPEAIKYSKYLAAKGAISADDTLYIRAFLTSNNVL
jgi:hypothetical protein